MLTIIYDKNAKPVADDDVYSVVKDVINTYNSGTVDMLYKTSNGLVIQAFRLYIKNGIISNKKIIFKYKNQEIHSDKYGNFDEWPKGFCDEYENILIKLIS